jgi:predicted KAP-like P-loop ATPase
MPPRLDNPITDPKDDLLGYNSLADDLASQLIAILRLHETDRPKNLPGITVGIQAPWGTGKSSFLNLLKTRLRNRLEATTIRYNPWVLDGTTDLLPDFFTTVGNNTSLTETPSHGAKAAKVLRTIGNALPTLAAVPVVGFLAQPAALAVNGAATAAEDYGKRHQTLTSALREAKNAFTQLNKPVFILIDDLDRLEPQSLLTLLKVVRLVTELPNLSVILAYDETHINFTLKDLHYDQDYLHKIIQMRKDLPTPSYVALRAELTRVLTKLWDDAAITEPLQSMANTTKYQFIQQHIHTIRDIRRYVLGANGALVNLHSQIDPIDILSIEMVRILYPATFRTITEQRHAITADFSPLDSVSWQQFQQLSPR